MKQNKIIYICKKIIQAIADLLFPYFCLGCHRYQTKNTKENSKMKLYLCDACLRKISVNQQNLCYICQQNSLHNFTHHSCLQKHKNSLHGLLVAGLWSDILLRHLIYYFKYNFIKNLCYPLAEIMGQYLTSSYLFHQEKKSLLLMPVPLHKRRLKWRGYNQSELLAEKIEQYTKISLIKQALLRIKPIKPQVEINDPFSRRQNVKNAFTANPEFNQALIKNKIIILIDDVCTTGATLEECAKNLKKFQPKQIWGLVLVRPDKKEMTAKGKTKLLP